eukprot:gene4451-7826_t
MKIENFRIDSYEIKKSNSSKYVIYYCLCTLNDIANVVIKKRYSEFHSLSQDISKLKQTQKIEFPPKLVLNNFQSEKINHRKDQLDKYMNEILLIKEFNVPIRNFIYNGLIQLYSEKSLIFLCLGTSNCGKTTFCKQLSFDEYNIPNLNLDSILDDQLNYVKFLRKTIFYNLIETTKILISEKRNEFKDEKVLKFCEEFNESIKKHKDEIKIIDENRELLLFFWSNLEVITIFNSFNNSLNLIQNGSFYLIKNIERICSNNYKLTFNDILHSSRSTLGIVSNQSSKTLKILDTGGNRSERKKWKITFQDTNAILFFINTSSFSQKNLEDEITNKSDEEFNTYSEMINEEWISKKPIFLIFNMTDLFKKQIENGFDLKKFDSTFFKDFNGENTYNDILSFIKDKYLKIRSKNVTTFVTSGFDFERNLILLNKMLEKLNGNEIDTHYPYDPILE